MDSLLYDYFRSTLWLYAALSLETSATVCNVTKAIFEQFSVRPGDTRAFQGRAPQITACAPPKRGLHPKERNRLGATGVQFGVRDPLKILVITPEFVGKNRFFADIAIKTLFLFGRHLWIRGISCIFRDEDLFFDLHSWIWRKKVFLSPKNCLCPPVTLLWRPVFPVSYASVRAHTGFGDCAQTYFCTVQ